MCMRTHSEEHISLLAFVHYFICHCFSKFCLLSTFAFHFRRVQMEKKVNGSLLCLRVLMLKSVELKIN